MCAHAHVGVFLYAMTSLAAIILIAIAAELALKLWADLLNLRSLSPACPLPLKITTPRHDMKNPRPT